MTDEKLLSIIATYEQVLPDLVEDDLAHLLEMLPKMRVFVAVGRREKLMRWLGWVQGVLCVKGVFTLEELKRHNMPDDAEYQP